MRNDAITLEGAIAFLNESVKLDPIAMAGLVDARVPCNKGVAEHATVQVSLVPGGKQFMVGFLGIMNGLFGTMPDDSKHPGWGPITAEYMVECASCSKGDDVSNDGTWDPEANVCPRCGASVEWKLTQFSPTK